MFWGTLSRKRIKSFRPAIAKIVNVAHDAVIVEVTGDEAKTAAFLKLIEGFGIIELARTGQLALTR